MFAKRSGCIQWVLSKRFQLMIITLNVEGPSTFSPSKKGIVSLSQFLGQEVKLLTFKNRFLYLKRSASDLGKLNQSKSLRELTIWRWIVEFELAIYNAIRSMRAFFSSKSSLSRIWWIFNFLGFITVMESSALKRPCYCYQRWSWIARSLMEARLIFLKRRANSSTIIVLG